MHRIVIKLFGICAIFSSLCFCLLFHSSIPKRLDILRRHLRAISGLLGLRVHFEGSFLAENPQLLIANHVSYLDIFVIGGLFPTSFLAKAELRSWPVLSWIGRAAETVFVRRDCVLSRYKALKDIHLNIHEKSICIFPEGTTSSAVAPEPRSWHRGYAYLARQTTHGVYSLGLHYRDQSELAWVGDDALFPHLLRVLARKRIDVYVAGSLHSYKARETHAEFIEASFAKIVSLSKQAASFSVAEKSEAIALQNPVFS